MEGSQTRNPETRSKRLVDPENQQINVSSKKNPKSYKLICKLILRKFNTVELKSLGNASENVVALAEMMVRNGFAEYESIKSDIAELEDSNNESGTRSGISFVVKLKKSAKFDELTKDLE